MNNTKMRGRRRIVVFPGVDKDFQLDEDDYLVIRAILLGSGIQIDEIELQKFVANDDEYRVLGLWMMERTMNILSLPSSIRQLENLTHLGLDYSKIKSLPSSIGELRSLKELHLDRTTNLSNLPEEIGELTELYRLSLNGSGIEALPPSIGKLQNLKFLLMECTDNLLSLPIEIGDLANLEGLVLSYSKIEFLPPSIGQLKNLQQLFLNGVKNLSYLPVEIGGLQSLEYLWLRGRSRFKSLPPSIGKLRNLRYFDLEDLDKLSELPGEIGNLINLEDLFLSNSSIASLPDSIGNLKRLMCLTICDTPITELQDRNDLNEYLLRIVQSCQSLGCLGSTINERLKKNEKSEKVFFALACNRARHRTGYWTRETGSLMKKPGLWPLVLQNAARAFDDYEFREVPCKGSPKIPKSDAMYHLLRDGTDFFVSFLNR